MWRWIGVALVAGAVASLWLSWRRSFPTPLALLSGVAVAALSYVLVHTVKRLKRQLTTPLLEIERTGSPEGEQQRRPEENMDPTVERDA